MILIGTSGYSFPDWKGVFYPEGLPARRHLEYYAEQFPTVEINVSFYRIPTQRLFSNMLARVPPGFLFWVKLYQGLTHERQMDRQAATDTLKALRPLEKTGQMAGVLAQFPWKFQNSPENWEKILTLKEWMGPRPVAVEFRHNSWDTPETYARCREMGLTYCIVDEPQIAGMMPPRVEVTSDTAYVRLHGRNSEMWFSGDGTERYNYLYKDKELETWAGQIRGLESKARKIFVFFNNCHAGQAARNAKMLQDLLGLPLPSGRLF